MVVIDYVKNAINFLLLIVMFAVCTVVLQDNSTANSTNVTENTTNFTEYTASWESLDKRPIPSWFDEAKIGILIHWGVHSVPSFYSERLYEAWKIKDKIDDTVVQFMNKYYPANFTYLDFGNLFKAQFFDANRLTDVIVRSGAKYTIFVAKHHDGFCMWPSKFAAKWNAGAIGPKRDLLYEMVNAVRLKSNLYVGVLYSMLEWANATLMAELNNPEKKSQIVVKLFNLVERYQPELIRGAGTWLASSSYYKTEHFLKWLYNDSPVRNIVVVNDQWGHDTFCKHGGYFQCDNAYAKDLNNSVHKYEIIISLDKKSWSYRREASLSDYLTLPEMIKQLIVTVCNGGNAVISVGLTKEGFIPLIVEQRLQSLGSWLEYNGEAIYGTKPWIQGNDSINSNVCYTSRSLHSSTVVYAVFYRWPNNNVLNLGSITPYWATTIKMLPHPEPLNWTATDEGISIRLQLPKTGSPSWGAWALRIKCLKMYASLPT